LSVIAAFALNEREMFIEIEAMYKRSKNKNPSEKIRRDHYNGWVSKYREINFPTQY
jgi:hypothetical protein